MLAQASSRHWTMQSSQSVNKTEMARVSQFGNVKGPFESISTVHKEW